MKISREKILEKRKKLQIQKEKDAAKLKALQIKIKKVALKMTQVEKAEENQRKIILGNFMLQKAKADEAFQKWLIGEIRSSYLTEHEKSLFEITKQA